jgi:replicative DNA helicase
LSAHADTDLEGVILATLMNVPGSIDRVAGLLKPEHFYHPGHQAAYRKALELGEKGYPIDEVTLGAALKESDELQSLPGGYTYLRMVARSTLSFDGLEARAKTIHAKWKIRQFAALAQRISIESEGVKGYESEVWVQDSLAAIEGIASSRIADTKASLYTVANTAVQSVEKALKEGRRNGTPTGFDRYDAWTGGLHPGELTILAARPGVGKSSYAGQLAVQVAKQGRAVFVFSLEMTSDQWAHRILAAAARVDAAKFRLAALTELELRAIKVEAEKLKGLQLTIDDRVGLTLQDIRATVRSEQARGTDAGLVVVDYLQLMRGPTSLSREQEVAQLAQGLKELAKGLKVPVVALSQLNRGGEDSDSPKLSHLRESGAIEQAADNVVFISPDAKSQDGTLNLFLAKQRNGPIGGVELLFDKRYLRFSEK